MSFIYVNVSGFLFGGGRKCSLATEPISCVCNTISLMPCCE